MLLSLFYSCYYAYLMADIEKTAMYYAILKEEYKKTGKKNTYNKYQLRELKKIKNALGTRTISHNKWVDEDNIHTQNSGEKEKMRQDELIRKIHMEGIESLKKELGAKSLCLQNLEHPCPPYGNVDMLYQCDRVLYPVEVKKDQGKHDLIGQINKYDLSCRMRLHLRLYDDVQPVTICKSYDQYTLSSLKKFGVYTLLYIVHKGILEIKKV